MSVDSSDPLIGEPGSRIRRLEVLRQLIDERFPEARPGRVVLQEEEEGIPAGMISEVHGSPGAVSLFVTAEMMRQDRVFAGLIDAADEFDPAEVPSSLLRRLVWVRCREVFAAVQAADLLLRDANLSLLFLDLRGIPARELGGIPASTWHRFQRLLEDSPVAFAVCSQRPCIAAARLRLEVSADWTLRDQLLPRAELLRKIRTRTQRRSRAVEPLRRIA